MSEDDYGYLLEAQNSFSEAAKSLRHAWILLKHHGLEKVAKELADTVLDVETSAQQLNDFLKEQQPI